MPSKKIIDIKIKSRQPLAGRQVRGEEDDEQEDKIVRFWSELQPKREEEPGPEAEPEPEAELEEPATETREVKKDRTIFPALFPRASIKRLNLKALRGLKWPSGLVKSRAFLTSVSIFLLILACFIYLSFLGVEIQIQPVLANKSLQETLIIDSAADAVDFSSRTIPGEILEDEEEISQQFSSSEKALKEKKAQGLIRVYNNYQQPQILVATTRFLSPDEKLFRSKKKVYIPPGSFLDVEVEASEAGPEYNIGPSTFSVPGLAGSPRYTSVFGKSLAVMQGGFRGEVAVVGLEDLERAERVIKNKLTTRLIEELQIKAGEARIILADAVSKEVVLAESSVPAGTEAGQYNYKVRMKVKTLTSAEQDIEEFARQVLSAALTEEQRIAPGSLRIEEQVDTLDLPAGQMTLGVKVSAQVYTPITADEIKQLILGRKLQDGKELLAKDPRIFTAQIKALPFWKTSFPKNKEKIKIDFVVSESQ